MSPSPARPPVAPGAICFTVHGTPRTKKNSREHTRTGVPLPSKAWRRWRDTCFFEFTREDRGRRLTAGAYNVAALFYRDALRGDAVGYYQGLADLLEAHGLVLDDKVFVSWDGSRLLKDAAHPRVDVTLTPVESEAA